MPRGPKIKRHILEYIFTEALRSKDLDRLILAHRIQGNLESIGEIVPAEETIVKKISEARNSAENEDSPWHVSSMSKYEIPPEALPVIMKAWAESFLREKPLTIRQVQWIARLYKLLEDKDLDVLINYASRYAHYERISKLVGKQPKTQIDFCNLWINDVSLYQSTTGDKEPSNKLKELAEDLDLVIDLRSGTLFKYYE